MSQAGEPRYLLTALCFTTFVQQLPSILSGLLLIEIADTYNTSIGLMGQIRTIASLSALVAALAMGFISVRYSYRRLFLSGLVLLAISSLGCSLSPNYVTILLFFALLGVSGSVSGPMVNSLVGQHVPQARIAAAVGLITGSAAFAYLVGSPSIAYLSGLYNWRYPFQFFVLPLVGACLLFSYLNVPRGRRSGAESGASKIADGYRAILHNRSAAACLLGGVFSSGIWSSYLAFSASFIRQTFLLSSFYTSISTIVGASFFILGSLSTDMLVKRVGVKRLAVYFSVPSGLLILLYMNTPNFWLTLGLGYVAAYSNGVLLSVTGVLNLEQVPAFRGTMMSLSTAISSLGAALGTAVVGWLLVWAGYGVSGFYMLMAGVAASIIYWLLVVEPSRTEQ